MDEVRMEDIVCSREGAALRSPDELLRTFVADVAAITGETITVEPDEGGDEVEALWWAADTAEDALWDHGYAVDWNDGYIIYRAREV